MDDGAATAAALASLSGKGEGVAGKSPMPPRRARTVGAPVMEAAGTSAAVPHSQALGCLTQGWPHGCSAPLQGLQLEAARGSGGLPAPWGFAAWLETPRDGACGTSPPGHWGPSPAGAPLLQQGSKPTHLGLRTINFPNLHNNQLLR